MSTVRAILAQDVRNLLGISNVDVDTTVAFDSDGLATYNVLCPRFINNDTTTQLLATNNFPLLRAYLQTNYPTAQQYTYTKLYSAFDVPVANGTAMTHLQQLLQQDASNLLGYPVTVDAYTMPNFGQVAYAIHMPGSFNNASTGAALGSFDWPLATAYLTSLQGSNQLNFKTVAATTSKCSNGCVIGVAAAGAVLVSAAAVGGLMFSAKRRRRAMVIAPAFDPIVDPNEELDASPPPKRISKQNGGN
jgi:hypothetical protein